MKLKKKYIFVSALILSVAITGIFMSKTYAKYYGETSGSAEATVAKWNFEDDNNITDLTVSLNETADKTTLVENRIAPGTSGSFDIALKNTSEVGVKFSLSLDGTAMSIPANLKLYSDEDMTTEFTSSTPITGTMVASNGELTAKIYWKWAYETTDGDDADTTDGEKGGEDGTKMTIGLKISGTQIEASSTAITNKFD